MDLNVFVIAGRVAAPPELRVFDSGTRMLRYLVTTRTAPPRTRVDVLPIVLWDPVQALVDAPGEPGMGIWAAGAIQRRFWSAAEGRRSRLEIVARQVELRPAPNAVAGAENGAAGGN